MLELTADWCSRLSALQTNGRLAAFTGREELSEGPRLEARRGVIVFKLTLMTSCFGYWVL